MQHIRKTLCSIVVSLVLCTAAGAGYAANIDPVSYAALVDHAERKQYVRVMVNLDIDVNFSRATDKKLSGEIKALSDAVLAELGNSTLKTTVWNNGLGQIGLHVAPAGLALLAKSPIVRSFDRDFTDVMRNIVYDVDGRLVQIEEEIERDGYADVELTLNLENFDYDIGAAGRAVFKTSATQRTEMATRLPILLDSLPASGVLSLPQAKINARTNVGNEPTSILRINKEGLYVLKEHRGIRSLRLARQIESTETYLDPEALLVAKEYGSALVIIDLQRVPGYTALLDNLPPRAKQAQIEGIRKVFFDLIATLGSSDIQLVQEFPGIASAAFRISANGLEKLYASSDSRIKRIILDKPHGSPALVESTMQMNLPQAWNKGYIATGQHIAILDTGIEKAHPFLQNSAGQSRVVYEACFGTTDNGANIQTLCPNPNASGDSPPGLLNSAEPNCTFAWNCLHGTHVAGIAAGKRNWNALTGVAPNANIIAIKIFSRNTATNELKTFSTDYNAALQAIYDSGLTEVTVNLSLQSSLNFWRDCQQAGHTTHDLVLMLLGRNVPVVASTGNSSDYLGISTPACVPNVIKVAAVNDITGQFASFSNVGLQQNYTGKIFLAPGATITSASLGGGTASLDGTSMAAPHVAGLYAQHKAAIPGSTVAAITAWIDANGIVVNNIPTSPPTTLKRVRVPDL